MGKLVEPKVYWVGYQKINEAEVHRYLKDSGNEDFLESMEAARKAGLTDAEILCSMFAQIYVLLKDKYPTIFHGAKEENVEGIVEVTGMKMQPYEKTADVLLSELTDEQLRQELYRRQADQ